MTILHLTRGEKAALIAALCITHPHLEPKINMPITVDIARESLTYPGILDLLKLTCDPNDIISLLTLIGAK